MSIREQPPTLVEIDRVHAIPLPPPSPLSPWSSPLHQIPSPPIPVSPPLLVSSLPLLASPTYPLGYRDSKNQMRAEKPSTSHPPPPIVLPRTRASMAMLRAAAPSTYILAPPSKTLPSGTPPLLPVPLPTSSPYFLLPSTSHKANVPEVTLSPQKRLHIALGLRFKVDENSSALTATHTKGFREDYGFVATLDDEIRRGRKTEDERVLMSDASNTTRVEVASLRTTVLAQQSEIVGLRAADRTRQTQLVEALTLPRTLQTQKIAPKTNTRSTTATTTTTTTTVTDAQLKALVDQGVANALATRDADRTEMDRNCVPYKQLHWEKTNQVCTCTLLRSALTWWNSYVMTIGPDVAYAMTWTNLKKKMTNKYCPRGEIKKLEV
nr:reverse transcriptase domain-containing protein [Tanacetum cinerariifolium]